MENIFEDDFFENDNYSEASEIIFAGDAAFTIGSVFMLINAIRDWCKNNKMQGLFLSVNKLIDAGIPEEQAISEYKKALKFLINKKFVKSRITIESTEIYYKDLNQKGLTFISGYYDYIGKVDTFTIKKAVESKKSKIVELIRIGDTISLIGSVLLILIGGAMIGGIGGTALITCGLLCGGYVIPINLMSYKDEHLYKMHKPQSIDAEESANIFDLNYFEV